MGTLNDFSAILIVVVNLIITIGLYKLFFKRKNSIKRPWTSMVVYSFLIYLFLMITEVFLLNSLRGMFSAPQQERVKEQPTATRFLFPTIFPAAPKTSPLPVEAWNNLPINNICLEVDETYGEGVPVPSDPGVNINSYVKQALSWAGMNVIRNGTGTCDATLKIVIHDDPMAGNYTNLGTCYLSEDISGESSLTAQDKTTLNYSLEYSGTIPGMLQGGWCEHDATKFISISSKRHDLILKSLVSFWGVSILDYFVEGEGNITFAQDILSDEFKTDAWEKILPILQKGVGGSNPDNSFQAVQIIGIGNSYPNRPVAAINASINVLIQYLGSPDSSVRIAAVDAMRVIWGYYPEEVKITIPALTQALNDPDEQVQKSSKWLLDKLINQ